MSVLAGLEVEPHKAHDEDGQHKTDEGHEKRGDPFGPAEEVTGLAVFKVQIHLLENVLGFKRDHPSPVFQNLG